MSFTCAWTGEETGGKGYLLKSTDGPTDIVSEAALRGATDGGQELAELAELAELRNRVERIEQELGMAAPADPADPDGE